MGTQSILAAPQLGELLRYWRHERGKSQLDLSMDTGISQRHLSPFVESGRSAPMPRFSFNRLRCLEHPSARAETPCYSRPDTLPSTAREPWMPNRWRL